MQLTDTLTRRRRREAPRKASRRAQEPRPRPVQTVSQFRARRGGGNQDQALYSCECGFAWKAEVTASPGCPHCGTPQAW